MTERDEAYVRILTWGLLQIRSTGFIHMRAAGVSNNAEYFAVEADHLHNIPSLIEEPNEHRHAYYLEAEVAGYLEHVDRSIDGVESTIQFYEQHWETLRRLLKRP